VYVVLQYPFVGLKFQNAFNFIFFVHCRDVFGEIRVITKLPNSIIHQQVHLQGECQSHEPAHVLMKLYIGTGYEYVNNHEVSKAAFNHINSVPNVRLICYYLFFVLPGYILKVRVLVSFEH
jgi:hypothetical protein